MKKEKLTDVLRAAATSAGYAFHTGLAHRMNGSVRVYPAVWLEQPVLKSIAGRTEGEATYRTTIHVMSLPSATGKEAVWARLEQDALAIVRSATADDAVCRTGSISCTPAEGSLTVHGECSVTLMCDITLWYYI
jgi:hypothetical protein